MTFTHMVSWVVTGGSLNLIYLLVFLILFIIYFYFYFLLVLQVINETIRLANIVPGIFRRVTKDVHIKGKFKNTWYCFKVENRIRYYFLKILFLNNFISIINI